jgi:hypothetical protein
MKIKVYESGETEFAADDEFTDPDIREALKLDGAARDEAVRSAIYDMDTARDVSTEEYITVTEDDGAPLWRGWLSQHLNSKPAPGDDAGWSRSAIAEIQAVFDGDEAMTGALLAADPDQQSAESAALTAIWGIVLRVLTRELAGGKPQDAEQPS